MTVRVRYFAALRERAGRSEETCNLADGAAIEDLWAALCASTPQLRDFGKSLSFAVNQQYVERSHRLREGDEVALIPPVSGG